MLAAAAGFELKLVVDEQEPIENPDPNAIYGSLRREHLAALHAGVLPASVTVRGEGLQSGKCSPGSVF